MKEGERPLLPSSKIKLCSTHFIRYTINLHYKCANTFYTPHYKFYTIPCILYSLYIPHRTQHIVHTTLYIPHSTQHTLHTIHSTQYPTHCTQYTFNTVPNTLNTIYSTQYLTHCRLYIQHSIQRS